MKCGENKSDILTKILVYFEIVADVSEFMNIFIILNIVAA